MDLMKTFGGWIEALSPGHPETARRLLLAGYRAQRMAFSVAPNRALPPSKRYVAGIVMDVVIRALARPESAAMVSLFTPCEPLFVAGVTPFSVETLSGYLRGTQCEKVFLDRTAEEGFPETMCSFHRTFLGAAEVGLMPKPKFIVYTNLACDGNMLTFPYLQRKYGIPAFFIEVPYEKSEEAVAHVAGRLREMTAFVECMTGRRITEEALRDAVGRSRRAAESYREYLACQKERYLACDLTSEMYSVFTSHILLGTKESETYNKMLLEDIRKAPKGDGLRLLWLHVIPYMQEPVRARLNFNPGAFISACDLVYESMIPMDETRPYESMARRMVHSCCNGGADGRIEQAIETAGLTGADGVVVFAHWGCKGTLGATQLMKNALEQRGLPTLILDGDACDSSNTSDGQVATRLDAFLEMLGEARR